MKNLFNKKIMVLAFSSSMMLSCHSIAVTLSSGDLTVSTDIYSEPGVAVIGAAGVLTVNSGVTVSGQGGTGSEVVGGVWVGESPASLTSLLNNGNIYGNIDSVSGYGISLWSSSLLPGLSYIQALTNNGVIAGQTGILMVNEAVKINSLINNAGATIRGSANAIQIQGGVVSAINNYGAITGSSASAYIGIYNEASIGTLINSGSGVISAYTGIHNLATGTIDTITNTASITGVGYSIINNGAISTLNNGQGVGNVNGALTLFNKLPSSYNVIISSPANYGQLAVSSANGTTTFGIYTGSVVGKGSYTSVVSGLTSSNLNNTSGNYNGFTWALNNSSGSIWDLVITGASTADTQQSLVNTSAALQNTFTLQNTVLANSFSYDCNVFGANNVCVLAGGRNTAVSAANGLNNTSALLIAAYRVIPSVRIGAYADQNLSVNNAGSTVNLGNNTPLIGVFGAWNERLDGTGTEVKVSAAYGQKSTTVIRQVVGTSESGSGSSQLNSQGAQLTAKYGFGVVENVIVSPYVGMRYTQNNMGGYTEGASSSVTAPLTYSALNTNATTALAGIGAQYKFIPQATVFASAGVETDTNTSNGTYSATGITGLTPINFNANPVKTRPTAMLGATYDVEKNQRIGLTGIYRQEAYQATASTTVMATYMIGL